MQANRFAVTAVALLLGLSAGPTAKALAAQEGPPPGYGWDAPPQELNEVQRQGFHDGIEGARRDFDNHRQPNVENRDEFRQPHLPPDVWGPYREGFRRGYERAMSHLMGEGGQGFQPAPPPPPPQWDAYPTEFNEIQQRGFHDGIEGARRDFDNHRQPNVENRDEFRQPHLPPDVWGPYREGFRRGYDRAMSHLMGGSGPGFQPAPPPPPPQWDAYPTEFNEIQQRGFHDGIEGARRDFENHRAPDVNNRDEYRHPHDVPYELREAYREGFRRGYDRAMAHMMGQPFRY